MNNIIIKTISKFYFTSHLPHFLTARPRFLNPISWWHGLSSQGLRGSVTQVKKQPGMWCDQQSSSTGSYSLCRVEKLGLGYHQPPSSKSRMEKSDFAHFLKKCKLEASTASGRTKFHKTGDITSKVLLVMETFHDKGTEMMDRVRGDGLFGTQVPICFVLQKPQLTPWNQTGNDQS